MSLIFILSDLSFGDTEHESYGGLSCGNDITESSTLLSINTNLSDDSSDEIVTATINKSEVTSDQELNQKEGIIINFDDEPRSQSGIVDTEMQRNSTTLKTNNFNSGEGNSSNVLIEPIYTNDNQS